MDACSDATPINQNTSPSTTRANVNVNACKNNSNNTTTNANASINNMVVASSSVVFENGTIMGAIHENNNINSNNSIYHSHRHNSYYQQPEGQFANIPEIVINGCYIGHQNLQHQQYQHNLQHHQPYNHQPIFVQQQQSNSNVVDSTNNCDESAIESTALLAPTPATAANTTTLNPTSVDTNESERATTTITTAATTPINTSLNVMNEDMGIGDISDLGTNDEFEQFMLNRSTSDSNILDSSYYSELQYQHATIGVNFGGLGSVAQHDIGGIAGGAYIEATAAQQYQLAAARAQLGLLPSLPQMPSATTQTTQPNSAAAAAAAVAAAAAAAADFLNTSTCSRESTSHTNSNNNINMANNQNNNKRSRTRKTHKSTSKATAKWNANAAAAAAAADVARGAQLGAAAAAAAAAAGAYPPQYTAIFLDHSNVATAANAMGHVANAAAGSPYINAPLVDAATAAAYIQQQPYQLITTATAPYTHLGRHHMHHRRFLDTPNAIVNNPAGIGIGATTGCTGNLGGGGAGIGAPTPCSSANAHTTTTTTAASGTCGAIRSIFVKCFSRPIVPFIIGIFALGGAACTLGGIVLGATGLIEHTTQYLSASMLMIGIGLSLLIVSGIIWRLCTPNDADECPCYRLMENCRNCNSPFCNNRLVSSGYLYPEFQHRPPPPSYLTSLHECAAIGLINGAVYSGLRINTPPPLYRSTNSLSVFIPGSNSNTPTLTTNTPTTTFTPTTVMPNNNHNRLPQTGPPNYHLPPIGLPHSTIAATELLLAEQMALIENLQTEIEHQQEEKEENQKHTTIEQQQEIVDQQPHEQQQQVTEQQIQTQQQQITQ